MNSFLDNPVVKLVVATLVSLFTVPIEFVIAVPLFWMLDFFSGLYATKRDGKDFSFDKLNSQYVKMGIHIAFLLGCVWLSNLFAVQQFVFFGFGYVIATEFISTIRNLFGDKKSVQIITRLKEIFTNSIGVDLPLDEDDKDKVSDAN